ncbi:MAG: hypothetical protein PHT39_08255 [Sphaerochaetaceae bacterium]|nr:hypothetical protein [Sphaerochaetaceae bacterium]MDD4397548.1 hypothetical protein [Sphaerochaetaceae bacterium]
MKRSLIIMVLLAAVVSSLGAIDTIICYYCDYTAVTEPYFTNTEHTSLFGDSYVAKVGSMKISVIRDVSEYYKHYYVDDSGSYLKGLYFRETDETKNRAVFSATGTDGKVYYLQADLCSTVSDVWNGNAVSGVVDLYESSIVHGSKDDYLLILPSRLLDESISSISPKDVYYTAGEEYDYYPWDMTPSYPTSITLYCPDAGRVNYKSYGLSTLYKANPAEQYVLTVDLYLKIISDVPQVVVGSSLSVEPTKSSFSSLDNLAACHNYNPNRFAGSKVPTNNIGGDLAFFPSDHFNKPIPIGTPVSPTEVNCWVTFVANSLELDYDDLAGYDTVAHAVTLGTASVLIYGSAISSSGSYQVNYSVSGKNCNPSSPEIEFRLVRYLGGTQIQDTSSYIT